MARKAIAGQQGQQGQHTEQGRAHVSKHAVSRLLPYAPPWLIWLGVLLVAWLGHKLWGDSPWYPIMAELAVGGAMWLIHKLTKALHEVLRILALGTMAAVGVFIVVVGILGTTPVLLSLWGGIGFTCCVYWGIRRMLLTANNTVAGTPDGNGGKLLDILQGAKVGTPKILDNGQIVAPLEANRGEQTQDDLVPIVKAVESLTGMRPGAGRLVKSNTDAGMAEMKFIPQDMLEGMTPWRGPSAFGESIALAIPLGTYEDMGTCNIWVCGDETVGRNAAQWLVMGMPGAGKSKGMVMAFAEILTRYDVTLWAHDHVKGLQTLRPLLVGGGIDWVSMTVAGGKDMLAATRLAIQARARWLGAKGYEQWEEGCGLNLLCVWLEEASDLAQLKVLLQLVREGRSAGVIIFISLQRASHTSIDTDSRAALAGNICLGVDSSTDARFGLPDHVIDAGAEPERWKADKPGYAYVSAPGIDAEHQAMPMRFFFAQAEQIIDAVTRGSAVRRPLAEEDDAVTVTAAGPVYLKRIPSGVYVDPSHPDYAKALGLNIPAKVGPTIEGEVEESAVDTVAGNSDSDGMDSIDSVVDDDGVDTDTEDEVSTAEAEAMFASNIIIPPCPVPDLAGPNAKPKQKLTTEQCRAMVQHYLGRLYAEGTTLIGVSNIIQMTPPITRGREWVRQELHRLNGEDVEVAGKVLPHPEASEYRLSEEAEGGPGEYRIVPPSRA